MGRPVFDFDYADQVLTVTVTGEPTPDDYRGAIRRAKEITGAMPGHRIWDLRQATLTLTADELRGLAQLSGSADRGRSRMALVANDGLSFGLSRMYSVFRENDHVSVRVFKTPEAARSWFAEPPD